MMFLYHILNTYLGLHNIYYTKLYIKSFCILYHKSIRPAIISNTERIIIYITSNVSISIFLLIDNKHKTFLVTFLLQLIANASAYIFSCSLYLRTMP